MTASGDAQYCYKIYHIRRGRAFIINNEFHHDLDQGQRTLTDRDAENVLSLLSDLGFDITVRKNCTAAQMKSMLVEALRIISVRKTGSGKSSEGNCLLGKSVFEEKQGMASKTAQCPWEFGNRRTVDLEEKHSALKEMNALLHEQLNQWRILTNGIDAHMDTLRAWTPGLASNVNGKVRPYPKELRDDTEENKFVFIPNRRGLGKRGNATCFNTRDNRNKGQDDCDQDRAAKEDRTEKRNLVAIVTGSVTRSSTGLQTGRTDVFVGNGNLLNESFRQQHNIRNIVTVKAIPLNADVAVDPNTKVRVRVRPIGEGKDSWEHCINQDGNVALPEAQFLCISQLLCGRSSFPASATWFLETPKKCPPSSTLEAVVEIELVTPDAIKRRDASSSAVNLVLSVEIQEKDVPNIYSDPELSSLWLNTDIDRDDRALEEKSQTEAMEK